MKKKLDAEESRINGLPTELPKLPEQNAGDKEPDASDYPDRRQIIVEQIAVIILLIALPIKEQKVERMEPLIAVITMAVMQQRKI